MLSRAISRTAWLTVAGCIWKLVHAFAKFRFGPRLGVRCPQRLRDPTTSHFALPAPQAQQFLTIPPLPQSGKHQHLASPRVELRILLDLFDVALEVRSRAKILLGDAAGFHDDVKAKIFQLAMPYPLARTGKVGRIQHARTSQLVSDRADGLRRVRVAVDENVITFAALKAAVLRVVTPDAPPSSHGFFLSCRLAMPFLRPPVICFWYPRL
jgi:hypothetical protein